MAYGHAVACFEHYAVADDVDVFDAVADERSLEDGSVFDVYGRVGGYMEALVGGLGHVVAGVEMHGAGLAGFGHCRAYGVGK